MHERCERREARVVRRVHVHHVELATPEEDAHRLPQERRDRVQRLRVVAVHGQREPGVDDLERLVAQRPLVAVDDRGGVQQPPRDDGHLMPAGGELRRLAVHVFGDAAELRVVVVRDDRDAHAGAENTLVRQSDVVAGTVRPRVPSSGVAGTMAGECRPTTTSARTATASSWCSVSRDDALDRCVECGAPCKRLLHAPAIHFKGSGFYSTDYGSKKRGPNGAGQESKSESGSSSERWRQQRRQVVEQRSESSEDAREQRQQACELVELELVQLLRLRGPPSLRDGAARRPLGRRVGALRRAAPEELGDRLPVLLARDQLPLPSPSVAGVPPRRQCSVRDARRWRQPSAIRSLDERSVVSGSPSASPTVGRCSSVPGEPSREASALSTRCWRWPRVRSLSAGSTRVLADARVGERVAPVEVQRALAEAPACSRRTRSR